MTRFTDEVMWKSIRAYVTPDVLQHYPDKYSIGAHKAKARGHEMCTSSRDTAYLYNVTYIL